MSKIQYVIDGVYPDDAYDLHHYDARTEWELQWMAQKAATDYFYNHSGYESHWPLDIEIYIDGSRVGIYSVEMEQQPVFFASREDEQ